METPPAPGLEFIVELRVSIGPMLELGAGASGIRRTIPIMGGSFAGPRLSGHVLPGGADWQIVESDGLTFLDARYAIETDDGTLIEVRNRGVRQGPADMMERPAAGEDLAPDEYYFRTLPRFYPPEGKYDWLRRSVFVATGERYADLVVVRVWGVR